jgi:hypothetical protein
VAYGWIGAEFCILGKNSCFYVEMIPEKSYAFSVGDSLRDRA